MKQLILIIAILSNLNVIASSCSNPNMPLIPYSGGDITNQELAQSNGWLLDVKSDSTYYFTFKYPKGGYLEINFVLFNCECQKSIYFREKAVDDVCTQSKQSECMDITLYDSKCNFIDHKIWAGNCMKPDSTYIIGVKLQTTCDGAKLLPCINLNTALPVTLKSFKGISNGVHNTLQWLTGSEINNDFFSIERSINGIDFTSIGQVQGNGNTNFDTKYMFVDENPNEVNYYRLKQVDFDGKYAYSTLVYIHNTISEVVKVEYFNLLGQHITKDTVCVKITRTTFKDGTVLTIKTN